MSTRSRSRPVRRRRLVIVRTYNATEAGIERMWQWKHSLTGDYDFCVSIDISHERGLKQRLLQRFGDDGVGVHEYTEADMLDEYPCLVPLEGNMPDDWRDWVGPHGSFAPWGFHTEAINLCFRSMERMGDYEHVWVFEDDVGVSGGSLLDFLQQYDGVDEYETVDLLSCSAHSALPEWCWFNQGTDSYLSAVKGDERFVSPEHVQRFSSRLLDKLHECSKASCTAWSEQSSPSLCLHHKLRFEPFASHTIGEIYNFDGLVSEEEFEQFNRDNVESGTCKIYHALKY